MAPVERERSPARPMARYIVMHSDARARTNTVLALTFEVFIIAIVVLGSLWITGYLNHNIMPISGTAMRGF